MFEEVLIREIPMKISVIMMIVLTALLYHGF